MSTAEEAFRHVSAPAKAFESGRLDSQHWPELDSIRGLAAIGVLALHSLPYWFFWAWSCVDLFFVLSGFLITRILLDQRGRAGVLRAFYVRRILRIWPVYYLTWVITLLVSWFVTNTNPDYGIPGGHLLGLVFLQNVDHYVPGGSGIGGLFEFQHSWSLAVEEQFYLLWPAVLVLLRPSARTLLALAGGLLVVALAARYHGAFFYLAITRIDGLVLGAAVACLSHGENAWLMRCPRRYFWYLGSAGLILLLPYLCAGFQLRQLEATSDRVFEVTGAAMLFAAAIATAVRWTGARWLAPLRAAPLLYLGKISFATYMFHLPVFAVLVHLTKAGYLEPPIARILAWVVTLALADLSYRYFERPILGLKRLFPYRDRKAEIRVSA